VAGLFSTNTGGSLADWDTARLVRFLQEFFRRNEPTTFAHITVEDLLIENQIAIKDQVTYKGVNFHQVGGSGEPPFANSWANSGGSAYVAGYWRNPWREVRLRGSIHSGTVGSTAFTLPPGFRPQGTMTFAVVSNSLFGIVTIDSSGNVKPISPSSNVSVSLDGISFKAEQ
jgi:hypothetical protein